MTIGSRSHLPVCIPDRGTTGNEDGSAQISFPIQSSFFLLPIARLRIASM